MYDYAKERENLFSDAGQRLFLRIRDRVDSLLREAGAFQLANVIDGEAADAWELIACVDRLAELGEIREVTPSGVAGQLRVFVRRGERR